MDLHRMAAASRASDEERAAVESVLGGAPASARGEVPGYAFGGAKGEVPGAPDDTGTIALGEAKARRHLLLPALHAVQRRMGWVSPAALGYVCERLHVPPAEGYGVASFYALFALTERPPVAVHVCDDIACKARGADAVCAELEERHGPDGSAKGGATWLRSPCLGLCDRAPAAMLTVAGEDARARAWGGANAESVLAAMKSKRAPVDDRARTKLPQEGSDSLRLLRRVGRVDPWDLDDYRAHGGYLALRRALAEGPAWVIREITDAKLVGRGGAAFPTGRKWEAVARAQARPRYVVCNADESEPGTFKDRYLLEDDPYAVIEAMTLAGFAVGADKGFLYVRGEYPLAADRLAHAIAQARTHGLLGDNILGKRVAFDIELRRGAGAYICGEETALFASIEGFRGEPRTKPPFPVDSGLFGKPTCINNVETLVAALEIVSAGAAAWTALGTAGSSGSKLFCLSGSVRRPGLYEVPFGTRLDALIDLAGGPPEGRSIRTVLLGGAAGAFVTPDELATPLTFEDARRIGATIGSGVVLVFDDTIDPLPLLQRIAAFFRDESCGQCVPCRVGTVRQEELIARLGRGAPLGSLQTEKQLLGELGQAMRDASICGLGQTASSAIESALKKLHLGMVAR